MDGTVRVFGGWTTTAFDTVYRATSDGFVSAYVSTNMGDRCVIDGYTDSDPAPSTLRSSAAADETPWGTVSRVVTNSLMMPVLKGDYWKVTAITEYSENGHNCANQGKVFFMPLGL